MGSDDTPGRARRSALFVDFDNIYAGLADTDRRAAEAFATDPDRWVRWLSRGADSSGPFERRFLVRLCYLNPVAYGRFRPFFTRNGFRVVDCPPLTQRQKNSADIHMVLDILDALDHRGGYDEFVVASADADFTPVMMRLRAHDRRTAIVTAGPAAAAYRSVCDTVISPDELAAVVLAPGDGDSRSTTRTPGPAEPRRGAGAPAEQAAPRRAPAPDERILEAVRTAVRTAPRPLVTAAAAQAALGVDPTLSERGWDGAGKFAVFLSTFLPDLRYVPHPQPGYVFDPSRHTEADVPAGATELARGDLAPLPAQVCLVTNAPALSSAQYAVLFEELAADVAENGFDAGTFKRVRDRAHLREQPIRRAVVSTVVQGLVYAGDRPRAGMSAQDLARAWLANLQELCANAQMQLEPHEKQQLEEWILGGLR
ncbi:NYN domain-containing protein [Kineococcus sp. NUM-3379]